MDGKCHIVLLLLLLLISPLLRGQQVVLKTNLLFWSTTTPNGGVEVGLGNKFTFEAWGAYNAWKFGNEMKLNLYLVQPELRYWFCQKFEGHFVGVHGQWGHFNIGQLPFISGLKDYVLRGDVYGGGVSYGYHWALGKRWGIEATVGAGYAHMQYDKYFCSECGELQGRYVRNYWGPTRVGVSIIYFIR